MERRQLLAASGLAFVPFGSCLGTGADDERDRSSDEPDAWPPDIAATEPVLSAGERAPLTVAIEDAAGAIVSPPSETDAIEFAFADADLAPSSASTCPGSPPVWRWDARTAVEIDLPVTAAPDTETPREYEYRVTALDAEPDFEARDEHSNASEGGDRWRDADLGIVLDLDRRDLIGCRSRTRLVADSSAPVRVSPRRAGSSSRPGGPPSK